MRSPWAIAAALVAVAAACTDEQPVQCASTADCDADGDGICAPTRGEAWCASPDWTRGGTYSIAPVPHRWRVRTRVGAWQPAEAISETYTGAPSAFPQVTVGRRGDAMVHWAVPGTGGLAWTTQTTAGGWTDVGTRGDETIAGVATSFDAGIALWRRRSAGESSAPWELTSSPLAGGQPWTPRPTPVIVGVVGDPVVAADHRGNAVAAWLRGDASSQPIVASQYDRVAGADLACDAQPVLAANAAGELVLVWDQRDEVAATWQLWARSFR